MFTKKQKEIAERILARMMKSNDVVFAEIVGKPGMGMTSCMLKFIEETKNND